MAESGLLASSMISWNLSWATMFEPVHGGHASTFAVRQTQTTADGLLDQDAGIGGAQRHDGVEIGHVPAFLEHVDVDDDLGRLVGVLHLEQPLDHLIFFRAGLAGIHLDDLVLVASLEKSVRLDQGQQLARMGRIPGDHQQEGLDDGVAAFAGVGLQLHLDAFVQAHAVFQLEPLNLLR